MGTLSDLIPQVRERVYNCPDVIIEEALRWSSRDFCRETHVWTTTGTITLTSGTNIIEYTPPADTNVVAWRMLFREGTGEAITVLPSQEWSEVRSDAFPKFAHIDLTTLTFDATPGEDVSYRHEVALMNTMSSNTVSDTVVNLYGDDVAAGARFKLLSQADRPWMDSGSAQVCWNEYQGGIRRAKALKIRTNSNTRKRVFQNRFI